MARPNKGVAHVDETTGNKQAKQRARLILATLSGQMSVADACREMGVGPTQFANLRMRMLQGAVDAMEPQAIGRPRLDQPTSPVDIDELQQEVFDLEHENTMLQAKLEVIDDRPWTQTAPTLASLGGLNSWNLDGTRGDPFPEARHTYDFIGRGAELTQIARRLANPRTDIQHDSHDTILSVMHLHVNHDDCLEILALRGPITQITALSNKLLSLKGIKNGKENTYYVWNNCQHQDAYKETGTQGVSYTTGVPAMIGARMLLTGKWSGAGVFNIEAQT